MPVYLPRTRATLFVVLAAVTGVFFQLLFGPPADAPDIGLDWYVMGLLGLGAGATVGLALGAFLGRIAAWLDNRRRSAVLR